MQDPMDGTIEMDVLGGPLDGTYRVTQHTCGLYAMKAWGMYVLTRFGTVGEAVAIHPDPEIAFVKAPGSKVKPPFVSGGVRPHKYEIVARRVEGDVVHVRAKYVGLE